MTVSLSSGALRARPTIYASARRPLTNPMNLPGLTAWFKPESFSGLSDGDPIGSWTDSVAGTYTATQGTAAAKPTCKKSILNGRDVARFDGGDYLLFGTNLTVGACTIYVVASDTNAAAGYRGILVANKVGLFASGAAASWMFFLGVDRSSGVNLGTTHAILTAATPDVNSVELRTNGASVPLSFSGAYNNRAGTAIGADPSGVQGHTGDVAEILVYDRRHSTPEMRLVEGDYLSPRFAIAVT